MDLLKLLIDLGKDGNNFDTCFLCFKRNNNCLNINTVFEICSEYYNISLSLADMIKSLFPFEIFLFRVACNDCSDLISKLYILINKGKFKMKLLSSIIQQLGRQISEFFGQLKDEKVILKVQMPSFNDIKNECSILKPQHEKGFYEMSEKSSDAVEFDQLQSEHKDCPETLKKIDQFKLNLKTHTKKRQRTRTHYHCNDCNYKTLCKSTLQAHINKNHLHTRPHICPICFKSFYNKSNLTEHIKTHDNQRNEICEICGCTFIHKKNLIEHLRLHSDTRPYECNICSKRFITSGRRSDHIKRSHMERSECCLICNKKYSLKKELTRHVNSVHSA